MRFLNRLYMRAKDMTCLDCAYYRDDIGMCGVRSAPKKGRYVYDRCADSYATNLCRRRWRRLA